LYHQLKQVQEFLKPLTEKVVDTNQGGRFRGFLGSPHFLQGGAGCLHHPQVGLQVKRQENRGWRRQCGELGEKNRVEVVIPGKRA
jgi:hypothetical protein